ncbi:MAG TPA: hypothetical protein EYH34_06570 [Planctomycetes bacterium]|nr:hypothetical protein [Planctomycetota bacterium]
MKKHYKPVSPDTQRPVLEQLLLACCLENAHYDAADEAFLGLVHNFFDWNEVRVSTVRELAEVMPRLPDPAAAAHRVKRVLQHVFESTYSFDLEGLRKTNLGPATEKLKAIDGTTPFSVAYVLQTALGGHAIPVDEGSFQVLRLVGLASEQDQQAGLVPGLERAIPKAKGMEFGSLLHQMGADFVANPYASRLRDILLEIDPDCRDRLPKRRARKAAQAEAAAGSDQPRADQSEKRRKAEASSSERTGQQEPKAISSAAGEGGSKAGSGRSTSGQKKKPAARSEGGQNESSQGSDERAEATGLSKKKPR